MTTVEIPDRPAFRPQEVCDLAEVQLYVLRTWEAEFPDLGVAKTAGGPRIYRRKDVELVLRIKHLLFVEGLTLAGVRRRFAEEAAPPETAEADADFELVASVVDDRARERLREVRSGLQWILGVLSNGRDASAGLPATEFVLQSEAAPGSGSSTTKPARARRAAVKKQQ